MSLLRFRSHRWVLISLLRTWNGNCDHTRIFGRIEDHPVVAFVLDLCKQQPLDPGTVLNDRYNECIS